MEKLEIKHLAPYLPNGFVNVLVNDGNLKYIDYITSISLIDECISFDKSQDWYYGEGEDEINIKPIFRPLSNLTKEIEINGKIFVPAKVLWSVEAKEEEDFDVYGIIPEYWKNNMKLNPIKYYNYRDMERLFKWHFDVFGLIEKGLAIDIKTLK